MATVTKGKTFVSGEVVTPQKLHDMVDLAAVTAIVDADISATAGIAAPKLASVLDLSTKSVTLASGEVSAAELATTLDLSTKTLTLPDNVVTTAKIADSSSTITGVTNSKIRQSVALSVIGNATNATAAPADIAAATDGHVMRRSGTAIGFGTITGTGIAAGVTLSYPTLTGVREAIVNLGAVSGTQTFNLQSGNIFQVKPNGAITVSPSNVPSSGTFVGILVRHEGDGTARTYTWPGTTKWAYGETPTMTSTNAKFDLISLFTYDGGTTWFGQVIGQNY